MVHKANSSLKTKILSFLITILIVSLLLTAGPADALALNLTVNASSVSKGSTVEFVIDIDINSNEILDINEIILELNGPQSISCKFSPKGALISGCNGITISQISNTNFGYGYGYNFGYGYGYGYQAGKLQYKITLDTSILQSGTYSSNLMVKAVNQIFSQQGPNLKINPIINTNTNSGSNSNNDDENDNNGGCFTQWLCSEWSACTDGTQTRTCEKAIKHCSAPKTPEISRSCLITENLSGSADDKDIEDYELSEDKVKEAYQNQGFFPTITGAVTGAINNPIGLGAIIFIFLIIGLLIIVSIVRRR